jgi:ribulose-5-phosphate 4-epimerase/fuculose-1-phosphate aldolase
MTIRRPVWWKQQADPDRVRFELNQGRGRDSIFGRVFDGKPVPTFPENALERRAMARLAWSASTSALGSRKRSGSRTRTAAARERTMSRHGLFVCLTLTCLTAFTAAGLAQNAPAKSPEQQDAENREDLVIANNILADQGVVDGFGHVSVRSVKDPSHYFISRSRAPALVAADDIMEYDLDDNAIDPRGRASYLERFIHSEIYKLRPDVQAVIHSHSPAVVPFGVSDVALKPISHMGGFLVREVPVFEIREAGGNETDMLIRNKALGAALAKKLGSGTVVLMRGHGDTVVGQSLKTAVFHAIYTEQNARLQAEALRLGGKITFLNEVEAGKIGAQNDLLVDRPWEIWKSRAMAR